MPDCDRKHDMLQLARCVTASKAKLAFITPGGVCELDKVVYDVGNDAIMIHVKPVGGKSDKNGAENG